MSQQMRRSGLDRLIAIPLCCLSLVLGACGGDSASPPPSERIIPPSTSERPTATADTLTPFARFDPCEYFTEEDYATVMGAKPETVKQSEAGPMRVCTREHAVPDNMASVQVAKTSETLLNQTLERARQVDVRPTPVEAPGARVYFMAETKTLYAYKNGVYLEVVVRAPEDYQGKTIEIGKRALAHIP